MRRGSIGGGRKKESSPKAAAGATAPPIPPQSSSTVAREDALATSPPRPAPPAPSQSPPPRQTASTAAAATATAAPSNGSRGLGVRSPTPGSGSLGLAVPQHSAGVGRKALGTTTITTTTSTATNTTTAGTQGHSSSSRAIASTSFTGATARLPMTPRTPRTPLRPATTPRPGATSGHRRRLRTTSPGSSKGPNSRRNSDAGAARLSPPTGSAAAPTHFQQLQAPPKKMSQESRGLKASRDIRRETISPSGANNAAGSGVPAGIAALLSSSNSRTMAPIVHVRVRPLLSYLNESNEVRKVWSLDHENMVVRAPTGTAPSPGNHAAAGGSSNAATATGGSGAGVGLTGGGGSGARMADRRPTLPPSKAKGAGHSHGHPTAHHPPTRSHSPRSLDSSLTLTQADKAHHGDFAAAPLLHLSLVPSGAAGPSGSVSEQSLVSDPLGSGRTSPGRLSTSSPPPLHLMQPSVSSSVSGTSTPGLLPRLSAFLGATRGSRATSSLPTTPGQEALANIVTGSTPAPTKVPASVVAGQHRRVGSGVLGGSVMSKSGGGGSGKRRETRTAGTPVLVGSAAAGGGMDAADLGVGNERHFNFEFIHDESATQEEVFEDSILRFADEALLAQNITILCYGPTGSGKTFSMMGSTSTTVGHGLAGVGMGGVASRRASMATGLLHARTASGGGGAVAAPSPSKQSSRPPPPHQQQQQSLAGTHADTMPEASKSECLEDSIAQVSDEDTDDDEWPLFDHTWYRDRQRRAMLLDASNSAAAQYGRAAGDNMRSTEMGILPRLVCVLLDRRNESITLNTIESVGTASAPSSTGPTTAAATTTTTAAGIAASERSASATSATSAIRRGAPAPPSLPTPLPQQAGKKRKGHAQPTRRTIFLTLRELTFYGIELYCDELSDLMDPGKRPITNVSDTGGLATLCGRLDQSRDDAVRAAVASASAGNRTAAAARAATGGGLPIESLDDLRKAYRLARRNRVTAPHARNERSSRSHAVFILQLRFELSEQTVDTSTGEVLHANTQPIDSYVAMVDLAGSERLKESQVEGGQGLREAQYINKSLSALSSVVLALYQRSSHIPYRDSKLTRMLRPCLEGGRVLILVHVAPCSGANTLNTLKFADQIRHTMVQTHHFAGDANKRGLLDIFADLVDPDQAKMEVAYAHSQLKHDQLCAELRLAFLSRSMLLDSASNVVARNSASLTNVLEGSETLAMSRVSSSHGSLDGEAAADGDQGSGEEKGQPLEPPLQRRQTPASSPSAPRDEGSRVGSPTLPPDASPATVRTYKLRSLINRHFAPLKASEDAGVQEAIHDIALERDRRVEAAKRKGEMEALNLQAAIEEMTRYNAELARENASPLPNDPYCQELLQRIRATTEEIKERQGHNLALQSCVHVLRQRVNAQEDIERGVDADVEEMRSKGLLPVPPPPSSSSVRATPLPQGEPAATGADSSSTPHSPSASPVGGSPSRLLVVGTPSSPPPSASPLPYMDSEVLTDAEMREIGYQQVLLSQELSALRMEASCYAMGDGIWEGLWARAMRQELLTALKVEVALMESVLLDRDALTSLAASAVDMLTGDAGKIPSAPSGEHLALSMPPSPAAGAARRKASPGHGRKGPHGKNGTNHASSSSADNTATSTSTTQQITMSEALATVKSYLELQRKRRDRGGDHTDGDRGDTDEDGCYRSGEGRASGERADKDAEDGGKSKAGGGLPSHHSTLGGGAAVIDIPNPLDTVFPTRPDASGDVGITPPSLPTVVATITTSRSGSINTTAAGNVAASYNNAASRHGSLADSIPFAYSPLSLVGSYDDEEKLQRMSVLKLLLDGVVCEAVCVGDDFAAVTSSRLLCPSLPPSASAVAKEEDETGCVDNGESAEAPPTGATGEEAAGAAAGGGERATLDDERQRANHPHDYPLLDSRRGSINDGGSVRSDKQLSTQRGGSGSGGAQLPMTKHFGRLRLVRKAAKGAGGARRNLPLPEATASGAVTAVAGEEDAIYCLEFVYSHHGTPLPPRLADAITTAITPSPRTQLEELVDSLPSPMDVRRAYAPQPGPSKALSPAAAALLKEKRLFSIPLNEPQLRINLHLLEAGTVPSPSSLSSAAAAGATAKKPESAGSNYCSTGSPLATSRSTPSLGDQDTSRPVRRISEDSIQVALELCGIPPSHSSSLLSLQQQQQREQQQRGGSRLTPYQQYVGATAVEDLAASMNGTNTTATATTASAASAAPPIGKDVIMARRLKEGGELLLPSPCIVPSKGTCTLLLRFGGHATANATRTEGVEAIIAALCGVMPPAAATAAATTPVPSRTTSPSKAALRQHARRPSPPLERVLLSETPHGDDHLGGAGGGGGGAESVTCVYPHVPHLLLSPHGLATSAAIAGDAVGHATAGRNLGGEDKSRNETKAGKADCRGRDTSPDPPRPLSGDRRGAVGTRRASSANARSRSHTSGTSVNSWHSDSMGGMSESATVRGAALRVHLHFPGSLANNAAVGMAAITLLATGASSGGDDSNDLSLSIHQSIASAAVMLQRLRVVTVGPFMESGTSTSASGERHTGAGGVAASSWASTPSTLPLFTPPAAAAGSAVMRGDAGGGGAWRVAQRLQQLHAYKRNIRALVKRQVFEAEDIRGDAELGGGGGDSATSVARTGASGAGCVGGEQLRAVAAEAREAVGILVGRGRDGDESILTSASYRCFPHNDMNSTTSTTGRGPHFLPHPYASYGSGGATGSVAVSMMDPTKSGVTVAQARELGGGALPWTLWQWAYRWPAITSLCTQLERAAFTAAATVLPVATSSSPLVDGQEELGSPQLQQLLQNLIGPTSSPRAAGGIGLPLPLPPSSATAVAPSPDSTAVGLEAALASPWLAVPDGSPALEPVVLPSVSDEDEDDMFNSFGYGNWMAESAAMGAGAAAQKKVWLPELPLRPVPDFLFNLAVPTPPPGARTP